MRNDTFFLTGRAADLTSHLARFVLSKHLTHVPDLATTPRVCPYTTSDTTLLEQEVDVLERHVRCLGEEHVDDGDEEEAKHAEDDIPAREVSKIQE